MQMNINISAIYARHVSVKMLSIAESATDAYRCLIIIANGWTIVLVPKITLSSFTWYAQLNFYLPIILSLTSFS